MTNNYSLALQRLVTLGGSDEGFYILAIHSFIEGLSNTIQPGFSYCSSFQNVVDLIIESLKTKGRSTFEARKALVRLAKQHDLVNRVRHQFQEVTKEEATATTYNFLTFCEAYGIQDPALAELKNSLELFGRRMTGVGVVRELEAARQRLAAEEAKGSRLLEKVAERDRLEAELAAVVSREQDYKAELDRLHQAVDQKGGRVDELRKKVFDITKERDRVLGELEKSRSVDEYLHFLERFSHFTRTRLDYERSVLRLTAEQAEAADMVKALGDYVVKGGAGTGKTLVLLHALERHAGGPQTSLGMDVGSKICLLTYTTTLVKYSRYLAHIVGHNEDKIRVATADSHILSILKAIVPGAWIDYKSPGNIIADFNATSFLSDAELATEIEDVIWGNLITSDQYLEQHILRRGMKQPLSRQQRELVWGIQERLREALIKEKKYTRNLACMAIIEGLKANSDIASAVKADRVFIDEAQDLSTAAVRCLKELSRYGVVLAADEGQTIYKIGSQYLRAGLLITGHVRVLKSNFRNTKQIHETAERFLAAETGVMSGERDTVPNREGPFPELVEAGTEAELLESLARYLDLATGRLGYDPENIGILAPSNQAIEQLKRRLESAGRPSAFIKDDRFNFTDPGLIRLSTLHSSKGIEFPVVLLWLPSLKSTGDFDEKTTMAMQRNLLYVALTRAMDHVVVFALEEPAEAVVRELVDMLRVTKRSSGHQE